MSLVADDDETCLLVYEGVLVVEHGHEDLAFVAIRPGAVYGPQPARRGPDPGQHLATARVSSLASESLGGRPGRVRLPRYSSILTESPVRRVFRSVVTN